MSHCQHVRGDLGHRVAPPPVILEHRALCFLMIIKLNSRCWAGNSSPSGPCAPELSKQAPEMGNSKRWWQGGTVSIFCCLGITNSPQFLHLSPCGSNFPVSLVHNFSQSISSYSSWWLDQPVKQFIIIIILMNHCKLQMSICLFLKSEDAINKPFFFFFHIWLFRKLLCKCCGSVSND